MTAPERLASITECAARVLRNVESTDGPQRVKVHAIDAVSGVLPSGIQRLVCPECGWSNGFASCALVESGKVSHRLHAECVSAYRARIGAPPSKVTA